MPHSSSRDQTVLVLQQMAEGSEDTAYHLLLNLYIPAASSSAINRPWNIIGCEVI